MSLYSLSELKVFLSIPEEDVSQDIALTQALQAAQAACEGHCKRKFERAVRTEYHSGKGPYELALRQRPLRTYSLAGALTSGAATMTGISSTADLLVGMPAAHDDLPAGTTIATITSTTAITLSANATASSTATVLFGIEVREDHTGAFGDASGAFPASSRLTLGTDYALRRDGEGGIGESGLLLRLGGGTASVASNLWAEWPMVASGMGTLTARRRAGWYGEGSIKVVYTAGYAQADVPEDLRTAIHQTAVWIWQYLPRAGLVVGNESKGSGSESYSYALTALRTEPELAEARGILRRYREVAT